MLISRSYQVYKSWFFYVAGTFLLLVAILFHIQYLYLMGAVMMLLPSVSHAIGRALLAGVSCERRHPTSCERGERAEVTLAVSNTGRFPKFFLSAQDRLPRGLRVVGEEPAPLLQLWPGQMDEITYWLEPEKRGVFVLLSTQFSSTDPLGIYVHSRTARCTSELVVYPTPLPIRRVFWEDSAGWGRQSGEDGARRGEGQDFHSVREYRSGDELRRVHWRTTARTGELVVMEFEQGRSGDVLIALDLHRDAYAGTDEGPDGPLEAAVTIAVTLADFLLRQGCRVGLLSAQQGETPVWAQSTEQMPQVQDALARAQAEALQTLPQLLNSARSQAGDLTLVFITPRADDPALGPALADWRTLGARPIGMGVDLESFLIGRKGPHTVPISPPNGMNSTLPGVPVQTVRRESDLAEAMEGGHLAR